MPSAILTLAEVREYLDIPDEETRRDAILDTLLTSNDAYLQKVRGPHPIKAADRDGRLPGVLLQLVALDYRNQGLASQSERGVSWALPDYLAQRRAIMSVLWWING